MKSFRNFPMVARLTVEPRLLFRIWVQLFLINFFLRTAAEPLLADMQAAKMVTIKFYH
jgi:hypothetical protein